jgi:hypothetical protein
VISTTELFQEALETWGEALPFGLSQVVNADPPKPGDLAPLPTLTVFWPTDELARFERRSTIAGDGSRHDLWGYVDATVSMRWQLASEADAKVVHRMFRPLVFGQFATGTTIAGPPGAPGGQAKKLALTVGSETYTGKLYLTGQRFFADPALTQQRNLWTVAHTARITYPEVIVDDSAGRLVVSVVVDDGPELFVSSGSDPIQPDLDV